MAATTREIGGSTRVVAVFGDPVEHSLSPRMHNAGYDALGLDYVYIALRPSAARIGEADIGIALIRIEIHVAHDRH